MNKNQRLFPEMGAGGFSRVDGTVEFYTRVRALLNFNPDARILDFGAGRGRGYEDSCAYRRRLRVLDDYYTIATDIDEQVMENPIAREKYVVNGPVPLDDHSVDLILADNVLEHVDDAEAVAKDFGRLLKPGGWICARTPHKWGYVAIGARLIPNSLHTTFLKFMQPHKEDRDTFPTRYKMNSFSHIRRLFPGYQDCSYGYESEPTYAGSSALLFHVMKFVQFLYPIPTIMFIFLKKPTS